MGVSVGNRKLASVAIGLAAIGESWTTRAVATVPDPIARSPTIASIAVALPDPDREFGRVRRCETEPSGRGFPGFPPGSSRSAVEAMLGVPHDEFPGYWGDTRALVYRLVPDEVSLGLIFDRQSQILQQTEASFAMAVGIDVVFETLDTMLGCGLTDEIRSGVRDVWGSPDRVYRFTRGALRGVVQHETRDRLYIGVWLADLHDF